MGFRCFCRFWIIFGAVLRCLARAGRALISTQHALAAFSET